MRKFTHTIYGIGASIIILGVLCDMTEIEILQFKGRQIIVAGLIMEAVIFLMMAFDYSHIPVGNKSRWRWVLKKEKDGDKK